MPFQGRLNLILQKQGTIKGGQTRGQGHGGTQGAKDGIELLDFNYQVLSPYDPSSGKPTGRRPHRPIIITIPTDSASPAIYQALTTNETLVTVSFVFAKTIGGANHTVTFTNAHVTKINPSRKHPGTATEDVTLTFENSPSNSIAHGWLLHAMLVGQTG